MTKESLEELRERLIRDERVRQMIKVRAYELYQMRGHQLGGPAQDWFQAEDEILAFLIADESQRVDEKEAQPAESTSQLQSPPEPAAARKRTRQSKSERNKPVSKAASAKGGASKKAPASKPKAKRTPKQAKPENPQ